MTDTAEITRALVDHLRTRAKPPIVVEELALEGSWSSHGRLDVVAVVIGPHYRGLDLHGYEVKTGRGDLTKDLDTGKWRRYTGVVNRLTFVIPKGLARLDEIPTEAGVMTYARGAFSTARRGAVFDGITDQGKLVGAAMRLLRAQDNTIGALRHRNDGPGDTKLERLMARAVSEDERHLRYVLSGRVQKLIQDTERRSNQLDERERVLDVREQALVGAPEVLGNVAELLSAHSQVLNRAREALGDGFRSSPEAIAEARAEIVDLLTRVKAELQSSDRRGRRVAIDESILAALVDGAPLDSWTTQTLAAVSPRLAALVQERAS